MKKSKRVVALCILLLVALTGCGSEDNYDKPVVLEGESIYIDHSKTIADYINMIPLYDVTFRNDNFCYTFVQKETNVGWVTAVDMQNKDWVSDSDKTIKNVLAAENSVLQLVEEGELLQGFTKWFAYSLSTTESEEPAGYYIVFGNDSSQYGYVMCLEASYVNIYGYANVINSCIFAENSFEEYAFHNIEYHINKYKEDQN